MTTGALIILSLLTSITFTCQLAMNIYCRELQFYQNSFHHPFLPLPPPSPKQGHTWKWPGLDKTHKRIGTQEKFINKQFSLFWMCQTMSTSKFEFHTSESKLKYLGLDISQEILEGRLYKAHYRTY